MNEKRIRIRKGVDAHCHLRQGVMLKTVIDFIARQFSGAVLMTNFLPAIFRGNDSIAYRDKEVLPALGGKSIFRPVMTIMLTRATTPQIVREAAALGVKVLKYIPLGVSTNSEESFPLEELCNYNNCLEAVQETGMVFSGHWESMSDSKGELPEIKREEAAIVYLDKVVRRFPGLNIVVEHASTRHMIGYVNRCPPNVHATLTVHHALLTYGDVCTYNKIVHGPHNYCKPIAKHPEDVAAVIGAMTSGDPRFLFGSDFAPWPLSAKKRRPPAAGIANLFVLSDLCWLFDEHGVTDKLEGFITAAEEFYGLPPSSETIELVNEDWLTPEKIPCGGDVIIPFLPGRVRHWKIAD